MCRGPERQKSRIRNEQAVATGGQLDDRAIPQSRDRFQARVAAALNSPFIVLFEQQRTGQPQDCVFIGEDADHIGAALDLAASRRSSGLMEWFLEIPGHAHGFDHILYRAGRNATHVGFLHDGAFARGLLRRPSPLPGTWRGVRGDAVCQEAKAKNNASGSNKSKVVLNLR
jgi:hypothetical protein